jgi:transcription initiation factor IIE alpha subunit
MNYCPNCGHDLTKYNESAKIDPFDNASMEDIKNKLKEKLDRADDTVKMVKDIGSVLVDSIKKSGK